MNKYIFISIIILNILILNSCLKNNEKIIIRDEYVIVDINNYNTIYAYSVINIDTRDSNNVVGVLDTSGYKFYPWSSLHPSFYNSVVKGNIIIDTIPALKISDKIFEIKEYLRDTVIN